MRRSRSLSGTVRLLRAGALAAACGSCALLFPPRVERTVWLTPTSGGGPYRIGEDGAVTYALEGLSVEVACMTDRELNEMFPQESNLGEYSINPYTYGDYVDPGIGYVRTRFTVFRVTVHNTTFAKVELDPMKATLTTDRRSELLTSYSVLKAPKRPSFEEYYRALRGPSGNDYYRYNMRMGLVRSNNYGIGEKVFRGESYQGLLVFDPLDDGARTVRLHLDEVVVKFNVFDQPLETIDVEFAFERRTESEVHAGSEGVAQRESTRASLLPGSRVSGNMPGDATREVRAVEAYATTQLEAVNRCFGSQYEAGHAAEGQVAVAFEILPSGLVEGARITSFTVVSRAVGECIAEQVEGWRFQPARGPAPTEGEALPREQGSSSPGYVEAAIAFEFVDLRVP